MNDDDKTPIDEADRCGLCGRVLTLVKAGAGVPLREPLICLMARDETWYFCSGERRGWTLLRYIAGGQVKPTFESA